MTADRSRRLLQTKTCGLRCSPKTLNRIVIATAIIVGCITSLLNSANSRTEAVNPYTVAIPPSAAILEVADALWKPVWCDTNTVAFQREAPDASGAYRRWIEYHSLSGEKPRIEHLGAEMGRLLACRNSGVERVMSRAASDVSRFSDQLVLVIPSAGLEVELAQNAYLASADELLRTYVLERRPRDSTSSTVFDVVQLQNIPGSREPFKRYEISLSRILDIEFAAITKDGAVVAISLRQLLRSNDRNAVAPVYLSTLRIEQGKTNLDRRRSVFAGDDVRLENLLFEQDELVLVGASDRQEIVVARCKLGSNEVFRCQWRDLNIDSRLFEFAGFDEQRSIVVASKGQHVGGSGLRACLFTFPDHLISLPAACSLTAPIEELLGSTPEAFYSMAPNYEHVAVLTSYHSAATDPAITSLKWTVVPTSVFRVN